MTILASILALLIIAYQVGRAMRDVHAERRIRRLLDLQWGLVHRAMEAEERAERAERRATEARRDGGRRVNEWTPSEN